MKKDAIKNYIVSVNGGTGVIFQPADPDHTYILTAKHIFDEENKVKIKRFDETADKESKIKSFKLEEGENYFTHPTKDIAILKIQRIEGSDNLLRLDDFEKYNKKAALFGFPNLRRNKPDLLDRIREDPDITFSPEKGNGMREAILRENATYEELVGQSGGGFFCDEGNYIGLLGIQNRIPNEEEQLGRLDFTPMSGFDEIIQASGGKLEEIFPLYLKNFRFLLPDIFKIKVGLNSKDACNKITRILHEKATQIANSDITPIYIRDFFREQLKKERLLLIHDQTDDELEKRKIWSTWFEFLSILNLTKNKKHCTNDCAEIFKSVRVFYSNSDEDFWLKHLHDLARTDYSGLKDNGLVVVATNVEAQDDWHVLDPSKIPGDIGELEMIHQEHQSEMNINMADDFPFRKYQFVNISAFKEDPVKNKYADFAGMDFVKMTEHLKTLYEQLIN